MNFTFEWQEQYLDRGRNLYTRQRSRFSQTDRLSSVNKMFIIWQKQEQFYSVKLSKVSQLLRHVRRLDTDLIVGCVNSTSYSSQSSLSKDLSLNIGRKINREINYLVRYL